jgi:predicted nucleic acid-binding protein
VRSFVDTNVLVYADDDSAVDKQARARELLRELFENGNGVLSLQVLREYFVVATRKLGMDAEAARRKVEIYSRFDMAGSDIVDLLAAIDLHRLHGMSLWDSLVVQSALATRCGVLYSEDLQHGRQFGGLRIENPFVDSPAPRSGRALSKRKA